MLPKLSPCFSDFPTFCWFPVLVALPSALPRQSLPSSHLRGLAWLATTPGSLRPPPGVHPTYLLARPGLLVVLMWDPVLRSGLLSFPAVFQPIPDSRSGYGYC